MKKIVFVFALVSLVFVGCKNEVKKQEKKTEPLAKNLQETSFKISGMTCEIGCAKKIQSDLSKKEGVIDAKVVFSDSTATVKYDATKIDKAGLATFIEGIADGKTYEVTKISDVTTSGKNKQCNPEDCKKECCKAKSNAKKPCGPNCKGECGSTKSSTVEAKSNAKKPCGPNCKGECGSTKSSTVGAKSNVKKPCGPNCKGECDSTKSSTAKTCSKNCKKECCTAKSETKSCDSECSKACCA